MNIGQRLEHIISSLGLTKNSFSHKVGLSNGLIGKLAKNGTALGSDKIEKIISTYPDINVEYLLFGRGDILIKNTHLNTHPNTHPIDKNINYTPNTENSKANTVNEAQRAYKSEKKEVFTEQNPRAGPYIDENALLKAIIKERDTVIEDKNKLIKYLEDSITQHKEHLNALNERICDKEEMIAYLRSTINSMKQTIENNDIPKKKAS